MAYQSTTSHLLAEFDRIARILDGYQARMEREEGPSRAVDPGVRSSPAPDNLPLGIPEDVATDVAARADRIERQVAESTAAGTRLRLAHLVETFDLSANHRDVLLLALLPVAYPDYQEVIAGLQNDLSATQPTVGLIADLFSETDSERLAATGLVGPDSPLRQHSLLSIGQPGDTRLNRTDRPVFVENRIESYLLGHDGVDPVLADVVERVSAEADLATLRLDEHVQERLGSLVAATPESRGTGRVDSCRLYWHGPPGTGKQTAVEVVSGTDEFLRAESGRDCRGRPARTAPQGGVVAGPSAASAFGVACDRRLGGAIGRRHLRAVRGARPPARGDRSRGVDAEPDEHDHHRRHRRVSAAVVRRPTGVLGRPHRRTRRRTRVGGSGGDLRAHTGGPGDSPGDRAVADRR